MYSATAVGTGATNGSTTRRHFAYNHPFIPTSLNVLSDALFTLVMDAEELSTTPLAPTARDLVMRTLETQEVSELEDQPCSVCLENLTPTATVELRCCRNKFHRACLDGWFRTRATCPLCRQNLNGFVLASSGPALPA